MIQITKEQKEIISRLNKAEQILNVLREYITDLYNLNLSVVAIKKLLETELNIKIKYYSLYYFITKNIKNKTNKTSKVNNKNLTETKQKITEDPFNLLK